MKTIEPIRLEVREPLSPGGYMLPNESTFNGQFLVQLQDKLNQVIDTLNSLVEEREGK